MSISTETYKKTTEAVNAAGEKVEEIAIIPLWEETKAGVIAPSDCTVEKTKDGYIYLQEHTQPAVDAVKLNIHDGLKSAPESIDAAADSLEKKEPTLWEQTETGASNVVEAMFDDTLFCFMDKVEDAWDSLTSDEDINKVNSSKTK